jgi:hypothetical protein
MDGQILAGNISKSKNPAGFKIVGEVLSVEPIACMLRKDDPAFLKAVDDSIKRQIADGSLAVCPLQAPPFTLDLVVIEAARRSPPAAAEAFLAELAARIEAPAPPPPRP